MSKNMEMEVSIKALPTYSNVLAVASITFNDCLVVDGFKITEGGSNGVFVSMPSTMNYYGNYHDVAFPTTSEFREEITAAVLEAYSTAIKRAVRVLGGK